MGRGAWWATVHGVAKSQTQLSDFTFTLSYPQMYYPTNIEEQTIKMTMCVCVSCRV